jgi:hypothetical protein
MKVLTQNKLALLDLREYFIQTKHCSIVTEDFFCGKYPTIERTQEVLQEMATFFSSYPDDVYEMPPEVTTPIKSDEAERAVASGLWYLGYRWIARDKSGNLFVFSHKPEKTKSYWQSVNKTTVLMQDRLGKEMCLSKGYTTNLFKNITWELKLPTQLSSYMKEESK